jgi:hypothetical protein
MPEMQVCIDIWSERWNIAATRKNEIHLSVQALCSPAPCLLRREPLIVCRTRDAAGAGRGADKVERTVDQHRRATDATDSSDVQGLFFQQPYRGEIV